MTLRAWSTGVPQTAGVGCRAAASSSEVVSVLLSRPVISVARCHIAAVLMTEGRGWTASSEQNGRSCSTTASTTAACSRKSLSAVDSSAARRWSSTGSVLRGRDSAIGLARTLPPNRETSSSGLAPRNVLANSGCGPRGSRMPSSPRLGRSTAKVYPLGSVVARLRSTSWISIGCCAVSCSERASTILLISPSAIRRSTRCTPRSYSSGRGGGEVLAERDAAHDHRGGAVEATRSSAEVRYLLRQAGLSAADLGNDCFPPPRQHGTSWRGEVEGGACFVVLQQPQRRVIRNDVEVFSIAVYCAHLSLPGIAADHARKVAPPSTYRSCTVMWPAWPDPRKTTASAMSSGVASFPSGIPAR